MPEILFLVFNFCEKLSTACQCTSSLHIKVFPRNLLQQEGLKLHPKCAYTSANQYYHKAVTKTFPPHMLCSLKRSGYSWTSLGLLTRTRRTGSQTSLRFSLIVGVPAVIKHNLSLIRKYHRFLFCKMHAFCSYIFAARIACDSGHTCSYLFSVSSFVNRMWYWFSSRVLKPL